MKEFNLINKYTINETRRLTRTENKQKSLIEPDITQQII